MPKPYYMAGFTHPSRDWRIGRAFWDVAVPGAVLPRSLGVNCPLVRPKTASEPSHNPYASGLNVFFGSGPSLGRTACHEGKLWGNFGALLRRVLLGRACPCHRSVQVEVHAFTRGLEINGSDEKKD